MIKLKQAFLLALTISSFTQYFTQGGVAISNSGNNPHPSAMLDVVSNNKGLLIPRLQLTDINDATTISTAENSLLVFNLAPSGVAPDNVEEGFYYWDLSQSKWVRLVSGTITGTDDQLIDSLVLNGNVLTAYLEDGGNTSVDLSSLSDADSDPTNEHNTGANLTGTDLNIIDGGSTQTVDLSPILDSIHKYDEWKDSDTLGGAFTRDFIYASQAKSFGKDVVVTDSGFFAVGTFSPLFKMHLKVDGNTEVTNNSIAMTDVNVLGSRTSIGDATSNGGIYSPLFLGQAAGNDIAHTAITSQIDPSIDNGTTPVMIFTSKLNPSAIVQNRPLFQWRNEANPQMTMLPNGNVGIGISSPIEKVSVFSNSNHLARFTSNGIRSFIYLDNNNTSAEGAGYRYALNGTSIGQIRLNYPDTSIAFYTGGVASGDQDMVILNNGNVGIGTTIPIQKLEIRESNANAGQTTFRGANSMQRLYNIDGSDGNSCFIRTSVLGDGYHFGSLLNTNDDVAFQIRKELTSDASDAVRLHISDNGNVGIGTINPSGKLTVSDETLPFIDVNTYGLDTNPEFGAFIRLRGARGTELAPAAVQTGDRLGSYNYQGYTGATYGVASAFIEARATENFSAAGTGTSLGFVTTPNGNLGGAAVNSMFIDQTKNVGIGTDSPTGRLSVNGTANKPGGGAWAVFSDKKLKKNITNYSEGLSLINKVNTVNFQYNEKLEEIWGKSDQIKDKVFQGVIAQELQVIAPDMVREVEVDIKDDKGITIRTEKVLEVDPNKFTYALINAVKEQQAIIESQKSEISNLKSSTSNQGLLNESLQSQINDLKALIGTSQK